MKCDWNNLLGVRGRLYYDGSQLETTILRNTLITIAIFSKWWIGGFSSQVKFLIPSSWKDLVNSMIV